MPRPWVAVAPARLLPGRVSGWVGGAEAVQSVYLGALRRAGLNPATIGGPEHLDGPHDIDELLAPWSGLVLCGGADVDPACYGEEPHPAVYGVDAGRDGFEIPLVRAALDRRLPILAICRGIQVLNVALGGTLIQHIPDRGGVIAHGVPDGAGVPAAHPVEVLAGSRLSAALGHTTRIGSCISIHHQAVDRLAEGLVVTGRSEDGIIEAAEPADPAGWCVAVQWHPERSAADDPQQQAIFDGFGDAARQQAAASS